MRTLRCLECYLPIYLPQCAAPITSASLTRHDRTPFPLAFTATDNPNGGSDVLLTPLSADNPPDRGVWTLRLDNGCQCFSENVFVDACPAPAQPATHIATRMDTDIMLCRPALQPDLSLPSPVIAFRAGISDDLSSIGIDVPMYGTFLDPVHAPGLTGFTVSTSVGALALTISFNDTTLPNGTLYTLKDAYGHTVAHGALTVVDTTASANATLADPLVCGDYYLAIAS